MQGKFSVGQSVRVIGSHHCVGSCGIVERIYSAAITGETRYQLSLWNGGCDCAETELQDAAEWLAQRQRPTNPYPGMSTDAHPLGIEDYPIPADSDDSESGDWSDEQDRADHFEAEADALRAERDGAYREHRDMHQQSAEQIAALVTKQGRIADLAADLADQLAATTDKLETSERAYVAATRCHIAANAERDELQTERTQLVERLQSTTRLAANIADQRDDYQRMAADLSRELHSFRTERVYLCADLLAAETERDALRAKLAASQTDDSDEMSERDYERMLDTFRTASEWHGGQSSALYSYSSTGQIHGEEHQQALLAEIDRCIATVPGRDDLTELDVSALAHLRDTVAAWPDEVV